MNRPSPYLSAALIALGAAALGASSSGAQRARRPAPTPASALARAQEMIGDGDVDRGRAVLDSLLQVLPSESQDVAAVLYARAATAEEAADAERDYRRVAVEYPTARVAADATLRLAQRELQRGERAKALERLQRLSNEQPDGPLRAQAAYWTARVYFENNDSPRGCYALSIARQALQPADVEVRNQVDFYVPRCRDVPGFAAASAAPSRAGTGATASDTITLAAGESVAVRDPAVARDTLAARADSVTPPNDGRAAPDDSLASRADSASAATATPAVPAVPVPVVAKSTTKGGKGAKSAKAVKAAARPAAKPAARAAAKGARVPAKGRTLAPPSRVIYTVQVAAVQQRTQATLLTKQLRAAGFDARVDGGYAPFRVRVGRYATRVAADAMVERLRRRRSDALVVEMPRK